MIYLDANVFINAAIDEGKTGIACRNILDIIGKDDSEFFTSVLTFDEVLWKLRSFMKYEEAIYRVKAMLGLPLHIISVDEKILYDALDIAESFKLKPRDAIHTSCMKQEEIRKICSSDSDFDVLKEIKRISPENLKI